MTSNRSVSWTWALLISLTFLGVSIGEGSEPGLRITLVVAVITAVKGRLVVDQFMELGDAHPGIRRLVRLYGLLVPALMVVILLFGPEVARLTVL